MISNPIYGGAYAYGKTRAVTGYDGTHVRVTSRKTAHRMAGAEARRHEGYVDWERAEAIRRMVSDNVPTSRHHGAPKHGDALLAGPCALPALRPEADAPLHGHEAQHPALRLSSWPARQWRAALHRLRRAAGRRRHRGGPPPGRRAGSDRGSRGRRGGGQSTDAIRSATALLRDLEAARYAADRAFRQYDAADPANRLVAGELETRWNKALARVAEVEAKIADHDAATPVATQKTPSSFAALAADLRPSGPLRRPMRGSRSASCAP